MLSRILIATLVLLSANLALPSCNPAQQNGDPAASAVVTNYPSDETGVLIQDGDWMALDLESPTESRVKRGVAASFTYGVVPATILSEYAGFRSKTEVHLPKPIICICHFPFLLGTPVLVRLHSDSQHDIRVLDGGRMPAIGAKVIKAKDSDLFPTDLIQPEKGVWLLRPTKELPAGEYALMFGTQNLAIFSFSVVKAQGLQAPTPK